MKSNVMLGVINLVGSNIACTDFLAMQMYVCTCVNINGFVPITRAGEIGPAAPVLAGPVFSQGKSNIPFLQKASNKQSASVIWGLIRLIILSCNR